MLAISRDGYTVLFARSELPELSSAGKGVIIQKPGKGDALVLCTCVKKNQTLKIRLSKDKVFELKISSLTIGDRARKGERAISKHTPVLGVMVG